ncbi:M48 family metalloprotease [Microbulbifer spongiae]|uniref:M48 family metalloprotease n=1 Tax=Microbulbifer spongiae TaxID=2944933 RepID=A0ABY9ECF8_9GAMM|nr:M48 family metalloprotease [Microbulbifer sp. MI-G]WKD49758.1 M48 family metalloprotease [Microbulbifer sp. MI-G]
MIPRHLSFSAFTAIAVLVAAVVSGCAVNPVTGEKQLSLISVQQELHLGQEQYPINQQQQGGQYTIDPHLQDYVSKVGQKLARVSDQPQLPYEFVVLNNAVPNAWALPGGKIAINRGLLVLLEDEAELAAVLSHEIVHAAARHSATALSRQQLLGTGLAVLGAATKDSAYADLISTGSQLGGSAYIARYGRSNELQSDKYGMRYMAAAGYDPQGAIRLQRKFVALSEGRQTNGLAALFASHPPSQFRVNANIEHSQSLPKGGVTNRGAYQKAIAQLKRDAPAYKHYDQALQAAGKQHYDDALRLVRKAQQQQPREATFFALEGDLLAQKKQYAKARSAYDRAVEKNPTLFSHWLKRGIASVALNDYTSAERDLGRSLRYLDSAYAHYYLGEVYEQLDNPQSAYKHYQTAAGAGGEIGFKAQARMQVLTGDG